MMTDREHRILEIVRSAQSASISAIHETLGAAISRPTLNRDLVRLTDAGWLQRAGTGKATKYAVDDRYVLFGPIDLQAYFTLDPDVRNGKRTYNFEVQELLRAHALLNSEEQEALHKAQVDHQANILDLPPALHRKEMQRLTIELSWKSAQIEGNTYSLL
jgi:hypothetical protein